MMKRVECLVDPDLDRTFPRQWCATAEVFTKDGKRYFTKVEYCKGDPENPLSWEELIEKFHDLSGRTMTKKRRLSIVDQMNHFEKIQDIKKWAPIFLGDR
jgi:2-methylcitrate dehydratase PrpD